MGAIGGSSFEAELRALGPWTGGPPPIASEEFQRRLGRVQDLLGQIGADAVLVTAGANLRYLCGLPWGATERLVGMVVRHADDPVFICPAFEIDSFQAGLRLTAEVRTWEEHHNPYRLVAELVRETGGRKLLVDHQAPVWLFEAMVAAGYDDLVVRSAAAVLEPGRMRKSPAELALMRQAKAMTLEVHRRAARTLQPGVRASEVARFIDSAHRALGADNGSTFCIVSFGEGTAYPHGLPGDPALAEGDVVLIDTGCTLDGYHSDITRTYVFGEPTPEFRRVWEVERRAQQAAFEAVRPGVRCEAIDAAARAVLEAEGFGPDYKLPGLPHRTGHGIGLQIHEPPYLVRGDSEPLAPGMCFSNEPMLVIPGRFGVRLEDHFHVTEDGAAWFTRPPASLEDPIGEPGS